MRASGFLSAQTVVSLKCAEQLSAHPSPYPPPCGRPLPDGKGLTMNESEWFSVCANRSQSQMCRATASAPVSLSPALRAAPSRCEGADDTRMASGSRTHRMGLTTTKSEWFSVCANRSQPHMCRATASAPVSLSPALRAAPSRWAGADDTCLVLCKMFFFIDQ